MPKIRLPLVGANSQRNPDAYNNTSKDCRYVNCIIKTAPNPLTRKTELFLEKRIGLEAVSTPDGTNYGNATITVDTTRYSTFQTSSSARAFSGPTLLGTSDTISATPPENIGLAQIAELSLGGVRYIFFSHPRQGVTPVAQGVYYYDTSVGLSVDTFTGTLSVSDAVITNAMNITDVRVGQKLTHANIPSGTRVQSIAGNTITMNAAATGNGAGVTITREHLSKIMSANFPTKPTGHIFGMNGRVFALDWSNGRIYQSAFNDPQTWTAGDYISLDYLPDEAAAIRQNGMTCYGFGQNSIEIFQYAGNASGSQLTRVGVTDNGAPLTSICAAATINGVMYFIGFQGGVYRLSGASPQKISTPIIDSIMASSASQAASQTPYVDAFYYEGRPFLSVVGAVTLTTTAAVSYTFWYDIELNVWTQQQFTVSSSDRAARFSSVGALRQTDAILFAPLGKTYKLDYVSPVYQDDSSTLTMTVQLGNSDLGDPRRKFFHKAWLIGDTQSSGTVTLEYSDDDYANWVTAGTFSLANLERPIVGLGSSHKRAWRLTDANNQAGRYQAIDLEFDVGTS